MFLTAKLHACTYLVLLNFVLHQFITLHYIGVIQSFLLYTAAKPHTVHNVWIARLW